MPLRVFLITSELATDSTKLNHAFFNLSIPTFDVFVKIEIALDAFPKPNKASV